MATATREPAIIPPIVLTLSQEEAQIIYNYTARASGVGPLRKASDAVWGALKPFVECDQHGYPSHGFYGFEGYITHKGV